MVGKRALLFVGVVVLGAIGCVYSVFLSMVTAFVFGGLNETALFVQNAACLVAAAVTTGVLLRRAWPKE